jgi:hypothetical protein
MSGHGTSDSSSGSSQDARNGNDGLDGGDPLNQSLSDFCAGEGAVVTVGAGDDCVDEIAEETFRYALCACDSISAQSNVSVDAFDSRNGVYGASLPTGGVNILEDGHIGLNGELQFEGKLNVAGSVFVGGGGVAVGPSSEITGNLYSAGTATQANASTTIGRNAYIIGNVVGRYQITGDLKVPVTATVSQSTLNNLGGTFSRGTIPAINPCDCNPDEILDIAAITTWGASNNDNAVENVITSTTWSNGEGPNQIVLPCGRYYLTQVSHPSTLTIVAEGRTVLFIDGDFQVGGGINFDIRDDAEIDIFIAGKLSVQASASFGDPDAPSKVRTYVGGQGTIALNASSSFGGNLYAPRSDVVFGASARLYGALFANSVLFSASADIHYDTAVRYSEDDCDEPVPDAGVTAAPPDATSSDTGVAAPDSGPIGCMSCSDCPSNLGCIIPEGESSGQCNFCASDLDCCPPASCVSGYCQIEL